ncbi:MAG: YceD family protein [Pyrinomonadaceae bacterium]
MIVGLGNVGKQPKPIELTFGPGDIDLDEGTRLTGKTVFTGEMSRDGKRTHVRGSITTDAEIDCVRCLEPVVKHIAVEFEDVFVDAAEEPTVDDVELAGDDMDVSLITEDEIDIAEVVREQLILATDKIVLCREDCKGLCPKCGENRNLIDCKCEENEIDPRWAALKNLN